MLANGVHAVPPGKIAAIVTYLEMTAKAALRDGPLPRGVTLRRATPDLAWYRDVFHRVGGQDWLWYGRLVMDDAALSAILMDPDVELYTLAKDGRDHALLELDFRTSGACQLAYFGLTRDLIGTGAGRALMNSAITRAWERPINRFHLHTCTMDSPQALDFYRRSGFALVKQAIEIDDDPRQLGLLPLSAAPHVPVLPH